MNDIFLMMERKQDIFIHLFNWNDIIAQSFATRIWTFFPPKRICDTILSSLITSIYQNVLDLAISRQMLIAGMEKDIRRKWCRYETKSVGFITLVCVYRSKTENAFKFWSKRKTL